MDYVSLPFNPADQLTPEEVIGSLPNHEALEHVCRIISGISMVDNNPEIDEFVNNHDPGSLRKIVDEIRFAHHKQVFYYSVPGITTAALDAVDVTEINPTDGLTGAEIDQVIEAHGRSYVICSVPEQSGQQQFGRNEEFRETTIGVITPGSDLLTVRAFDSGSADDTLRAITEKADTIAGKSIRKSLFKQEFAERFIDEYRSLEFTNQDPKSAVGNVTVDADLPKGIGTALEDDLIQALRNRSDMRHTSSRVALSIPEKGVITLSYEDTSVRFQKFTSEQRVLAVSDAVRAVVEE